MEEINSTTRMFPRTTAEAFPKDVMNDVFEGPYRDPQISDFAILLAWISIIALIVIVFDIKFWRP